MSEAFSGPISSGSYEHGDCKHPSGKHDKPAPWTMPTALKDNRRDRTCVNRIDQVGICNTRATSPTFCDRRRRHNDDEDSNCTSKARRCHALAGDVERACVRDGKGARQHPKFSLCVLTRFVCSPNVFPFRVSYCDHGTAFVTAHLCLHVKLLHARYQASLSTLL